MTAIPDLLAATINAVVATCQHLCEKTECGIASADRVPGTGYGWCRCEDCPLDTVNTLVDLRDRIRQDVNRG